MSAPARMVAVSGSGRFAVVREGGSLWLEDARRGPRPSPICDGNDFSCIGDQLWVCAGGRLSRYSMSAPAASAVALELPFEAEGVIGDGDILVVRGSDRWLVVVPTASPTLHTIATEPGDLVFPIGCRRVVRVRAGAATLVGLDGLGHEVDVGGSVRFAGPALGGCGWVALVDRDGARELVVLEGVRRVRRIGIPFAAALRTGAASSRAVVVTRRGEVLIVDLRTGAASKLDSVTADRIDVACDRDGRRVVVAASLHDAIVVHEAKLARC